MAAARAFFVAVAGSAGLLARRLLPAPRGVLRAARRRVRAAAGLLARRWDRSLQLRVIGTTLVISVAVVAVLGIFLVQQIANGLLNNERDSARTQTSQGQTEAQDQLSLGGSNSISQSSLSSLARSLQSGSGPGNYYSVVILLRETPLNSALGGSNSALGGLSGPALPPSVPPQLVKSVAREQAQGLNDSLYTMPTTLAGAGPALAVGVPVNGSVQLYYLFPLTQQIQTLQLVQKTLILAGAWCCCWR